MLISACIFGYGPLGKSVVEKLRALDGYGQDFRIHMVQVANLSDFPEAELNSKGQWKLNDWAFEDEDQGISFGDDLEWLRAEGWEGHDTIIDCSQPGDYFAEEIEYQLNTSQPMRLYVASDLDEGDSIISEISSELESRRKAANG